MAMYNPKVTIGDVPEGDQEHAAVLKQSGNFGPKHDEFYHDAKGAIERLQADKDGEAVAALHHPEVGDIDLFYGKTGTADKKFTDGYGLAKIAAKHPEVMDDLQGHLDGMKVAKRSENRIQLGDETGRAVVRLSKESHSGQWLLTAFKRAAEGASAADGGNTDVPSHAEPAPTPAGPEADTDILYQDKVPAWFRKLPAAAEGEDHPTLVQLRERAAASGVPLSPEQDQAAREAIDAAARGDDDVWMAAQERYQKLKDEDPRTAELRAARETYSKLHAEAIDDPPAPGSAEDGPPGSVDGPPGGD